MTELSEVDERCSHEVESSRESVPALERVSFREDEHSASPALDLADGPAVPPPLMVSVPSDMPPSSTPATLPGGADVAVMVVPDGASEDAGVVANRPSLDMMIDDL